MPLKGNFTDTFRVDLNPAYFNKQIDDRGYTATWEKAVVCPNRIARKENHNLNCALCDGLGYVYFDPQPARVLVTSVNVREIYQQAGRFDLGTVYLTAKQDIKMSFWDRITLADPYIRFTEAKERTKGKIADKLKYAPGVVDYVVDAKGNTYKQGAHFTIVGKEIQWTGGGPAQGTYYSLTYEYHPIYIVTDLIHAFRSQRMKDVDNGGDTTGNFPVQALGKLEFLIGDENRT